MAHKGWVTFLSGIEGIYSKICREDDISIVPQFVTSVSLPKNYYNVLQPGLLFEDSENWEPGLLKDWNQPEPGGRCACVNVTPWTRNSSPTAARKTAAAFDAFRVQPEITWKDRSAENTWCSMDMKACILFDGRVFSKPAADQPIRRSSAIYSAWACQTAMPRQ